MAATDSNVIEEIVVTARRQAERLQDVPLAISAFSAQLLERAHVKTLEDLAQLTPGITVSSSGAEAGLLPTFRGQTNLSFSGDPNIAVFLDGVYLTNTGAISLGLIDMERIEVVKGPVSALYGRNAFAGAINYVSKKPPEFLSGDVAVTYGNAGQKSLKASVGGPIQAGVLGARLVAGYDKLEGTHEDYVTGRRAGGFEKKDAQFSFDATPSDKLNIDGSVYYGKDFFDVTAVTYLDNNCGLTSTNAVSLGERTRFCGEVKQTRPLEVATPSSAAGVTGNNRKVLNSHLKTTYDLGLADVSVLLGYNKVTLQRYNDFTGRRDGLRFQLFPGPGTAFTNEYFGGDTNTEDNSAELRLASKRDQRLRWAGGFYYYSLKNTSSTIVGLDGSRLPAGQSLRNPALALALTPQRFVTSNGQFSESFKTVTAGTDKINSEFASAEFDILPNLTALAEARHTSQKKTQDLLRSTAVENTVRPLGPAIDASFSYNNYRGSANYKLNPNAMIYGSVANGVKAGGFNSGATLASERAFQPETNVTYEAGAKNTLLSGHLQLNIAVFHVKSKELQIIGPSDDPVNNGLVVKNFGGATTNGFELEAVARPLSGWTVNGGLGFSNPKFDHGTYDYSNAALCLAIPGCAQRVVTIQTPQGPRSVVDLSGNVLQKSSKYQVSLGTQLTMPLNDGWDWYGRIDYRYESKSYTTPLNENYWGKRNVVNLNTGIENDKYRVVFFVKNLTNNQTPTNAIFNSRLNDGLSNEVAYLPEKRTFGITASYQY